MTIGIFLPPGIEAGVCLDISRLAGSAERCHTDITTNPRDRLLKHYEGLLDDAIECKRFIVALDMVAESNA